MYRLIKIKFFLLCLCLCWTFSVLASSVPQKINYQGQLLKDGNPVTGIKSIYFSISDSSWFELHSSLSLRVKHSHNYNLFCFQQVIKTPCVP